MPGVVVLNADARPLGVVPVRRALTYIGRADAVIVESVPGETISSANGTFVVPRVVQFVEAKSNPIGLMEVQPWSRRGVLERDRSRCAYCSGKNGPGVTIDHVMPRSRSDNPDTWKNTVASCHFCNNVKGALTPDEAGMPLLFEPYDVLTIDILIRQIKATGADLKSLGLA